MNMKRWMLNLMLPVGICLCASVTSRAADREVSFKTEDGWTIHAALSLPDKIEGKIPAVILLPSVDHDRAAFGVYKHPGQYQYPGLSPVITRRGAAALAVDLRGQGKSIGRGSIDTITTEDRAKFYLDVRAAIDFLQAQPQIDPARIALLAEGPSAEAAVRGWDGDGRITAMAFISGRLSEAAKQMLSIAPELPLLAVVSSEDKRAFADMTSIYFASKNPMSKIDIYYGLGIGTAMFSVFRYKHPNEKPLQESIGDWISDQVLLTGVLSEVSFTTEDGWEIHANLRIPQGREQKSPAVVLFHSGLSDRYAYQELEVALARNGLAVLNLDWRGKGKSTNKGKYFDVSREERNRGGLDAKAAVAFLASQPGIDAERIGVIGTVIGARYAMSALPEDPRIKTAVVLTGYIPTEQEKQYLTTHNVPVLYVTSNGHGPVTKALTEIHQSTRDRGSELITYDGGAIGYQLFKLDKNLLPRVVRWMREKLHQ